MTRKLHGVNASPYVRKARVALAEKGLDYELIPLMPFEKTPELLKISPLGKIPVLEEDGWTIADSSIIINYLEQSYDGTALYPSDARAQAEALFLEEWSDTALTGALGTVFVQRVVNPLFRNQESDQGEIDTALNETLPPLLDYLEGRLGESGGEFLVGNSLSVADISIASPFVNFEHAGESVDATRWPKVAAYVGGLHARPSFAAFISEEKAAFGSS